MIFEIEFNRNDDNSIKHYVFKILENDIELFNGVFHTGDEVFIKSYPDMEHQRYFEFGEKK